MTALWHAVLATAIVTGGIAVAYGLLVLWLVCTDDDGETP